MARRRRRFGRVRELPSGRFQARYPGPDGLLRAAPQVFMSRTEAEQWLSVVESDLLRGTWIDPAAGRVLLAEYAERWINERPGLAPKTRVLYGGLLRLHIKPTLDDVSVADLTPARVRTWRKELLDSGTGAVTVAKAYRLLKAVLNTAVDDELIRRNPCRIKGAGTERSPERHVSAPGLRLGRALDEHAQAGADGRVFVGPTGAIPRRTNFQATWRKAGEAAAVPGLHFHDPRHTGNMLAAESASLRELMARMGHSSTRAALIYQHASRDRERAIAAAVSARVEAARPKVEGHDRGTATETAPKRASGRRTRKRP